MKFNTRFTLKDQEGKEKIKSKFLFFPTSFKDDNHKFWLERKDIVYRVTKVDDGDDFFTKWCWKWVPVRFASEKDMLNLERENDRHFIDYLFDYAAKWQTWIVLDLLVIVWFALTRFSNTSGVLCIFLLLKMWQTAFNLLNSKE